MKITKELVLDALRKVTICGDKESIVDKNQVSAIVIRDHKVGFVVALDTSKAGLDHKSIISECEEAVKALPGVEKVMVVLTADTAAPDQSISTNSSYDKKISNIQSGAKPKKSLKGIKHLILVASGKGGVGKSTVAVNLAVMLAREGYKIGLVDADIYGPSVPHLLGVSEAPEIEDGLMVPHAAYGIKSISIGYLFTSDTAAVWRGPMATKALYKLLESVKWGELDVLIIDMPPGTGDIHLSVAENYQVSGSIIVSTPQELALLDVRKAINMFGKVNIEILGIVENMSYFIEPQTGNKHYLFGKSGANKMATKYNIKFLGEIPMFPEIGKSADIGIPITSSESRNIYPEIQAYYKVIAENVLYALKLKT